MKVRVKKIAVDGWAGLKRYDNCVEKVSVGYDAKGSGSLKTGLTKEQEKDWEKRLGLKDGELAKNSDFWKTFFVPMTSEFELDLDDDLQAFYYHVLQQKKIVAKSLEELKENPNAVYVIYDAEAEAKQKNIKRKVSLKASARFASMSTEDMKKVLYVIEPKNDPTNLSSELIEDMLGEYAQTKPELFLEVADDPHLNEKLFVIACTNIGLLTKKGHDYYYDRTFLGDLDEAVTWLLNKANNEAYLSLKRQSTAKMKGKSKEKEE